ncbi:MAG TPA: zinc-dependent metalloprotease, partial [Ferruginibacter sp.]|nr:zinc-dependent metalloprotease [Ferruginibacter sp.]
HPTISLNAAGDIDISNAYAKGIGDWDKVAIRWGYSDFVPATDESSALNKILTEAEKKGLQFISDRDARAAGGLHPFAHLWDNGSNAIDELKNVMLVRNKALQQFGENNIRPGTPMSFLEDALVPVYLYHRYQLEAVAKWVGGMNYTYALRGDGQLVTQALSKSDQLKALNALIDCMDPKNLVLPEKILALIPPRPAGYEYTRELFKKRTGLAFDALSPAETAADLPLSFLFSTERLNRMMEYAQSSGGLSAEEMIQLLSDKTWNAPRLNGMEGLIQLQTEQLLLTYLLSTSINDNASFATRSIMQKALADLKAWIDEKRKTSTDPLYSGHLLLAIERMKFPERAKP